MLETILLMLQAATEEATKAPPELELTAKIIGALLAVVTVVPMFVASKRDRPEWLSKPGLASALCIVGIILIFIRFTN